MREQTTLRLPPELLEQIQQKAQERGDSVNETIVRLIRKGIELESRHSELRNGG